MDNNVNIIADMIVHLSKTLFENVLRTIKIPVGVISRVIQRIGKGIYRNMLPRFMKRNIERIIEEQKQKKRLKEQAKTNPQVYQTPSNIMVPCPPKNQNLNPIDTNPIKSEVPKRRKLSLWNRKPKSSLESKSNTSKKRFWNFIPKKAIESQIRQNENLTPDQNLSPDQTNPHFQQNVGKNMKPNRKSYSSWDSWKPIETNPHFNRNL